jgi:Lon protease-like protein
MVSVLRDLLAHPLIQELNPQVDFNEDRSVSLRVADLLPIAPEAKQWLLEMSAPEARLTELQAIIKQLAD